MIQQAFIQGMAQVATNFYYMPNNPDTLFAIATFFHNLQYYQKAIDYYQQSLKYFGESATTLYNLALCFYLVHDPKASLNLFKKAKQHLSGGNNDMLKKINEWIKRIEKKYHD